MNTIFFLLWTIFHLVVNVKDHPDEFVDANSIPRTYPSLVQQNFTWVDWMLTSKPKYFGLVPGTAFPTGVGLLVILLIMFICSMKWVRKGGYFEVKTNFYDCSINYRYLIEYPWYRIYNVYFSDYKIVWIFNE